MKKILSFIIAIGRFFGLITADYVYKIKPRAASIIDLGGAWGTMPRNARPVSVKRATVVTTDPYQVKFIHWAKCLSMVKRLKDMNKPRGKGR